MSVLPPEILEEILYLSLLPRKSMTSLLVSERTVPYLPRNLELDITGDESQLIFIELHILFSQCLSGGGEGTKRDEDGRLCLDLLRLRLNSHASDVRIEMIYNALALVNPRRFIWTGTGSPYYFSIAIVPQAIPHLFRALTSYTNLVYLHLTHLSMAPSALISYSLPIIPSLQTLYLGQVTYFDPLTVANFIFDPQLKHLKKMRLVDAYTKGIWGPRLRTSDIELAATTIDHFPDKLHRFEEPFTPTSNTFKDVIRDIVICGEDRVSCSCQ